MQRIVVFLMALIVVTETYAYDPCASNGLDRCETHSKPVEFCKKAYFGELPEKQSNTTQICHPNYLIGANAISKTSNWVAYHLYADQTPLPDSHRQDYYCADPCLKTGARTEVSDYSGVYPTYNRGHLNPANDNKWDREIYKESYYLSNIVPQNPDNNGGIWLLLENYVDEWKKIYGELYIITGPVYDYKGIKHKEIGNGKIWAPAALFKIIYAPRVGKVLSFIIPNIAIKPYDLEPYLVSIDEVNKETKLDLLSSLSKELKKSKPTELWPTKI